MALGGKQTSVLGGELPAQPSKEVCVCGSKHLCGCGCGQPINPSVRRVHELRAEGLSYAAIGRQLGVKPDGSYLRTLDMFPPLARKGHTVPWAVQKVLCADWPQKAASYEAQLAVKRENAMRKRVLAERKKAARRARWWQSASRQAPLRLDAPLRDSFTTFGDLIASPDGNPQAAIEAAELRDLLGGIDVFDVEQMTEDTLDWLRYKIVEAGYSTMRITQPERAHTRPKRRAERVRKEMWSEIAAIGGLDPDDVEEGAYIGYGLEGGYTDTHKLGPFYRERKRVREARLAERREARRGREPVANV